MFFERTHNQWASLEYIFSELCHLYCWRECFIHSVHAHHIRNPHSVSLTQHIVVAVIVVIVGIERLININWPSKCHLHRVKQVLAYLFACLLACLLVFSSRNAYQHRTGTYTRMQGCYTLIKCVCDCLCVHACMCVDWPHFCGRVFNFDIKFARKLWFFFDFFFS